MSQEVVRVDEAHIMGMGGRGGLPDAANAGAVAIEQERAIMEAQGQLVLAKRFPRSLPSATTEFLDACKSPEFAEKAFYSVPNRGSGESIRFAEEAARCYGNFEFGHRELSRSEGKSEVEVYAWDKEKNNFSRRQITVMHIMDTKNGPKVLRDQGDIDNRIANIASRHVRGRILALLPKALVAAGVSECKRTLAGGNEKPVSQRIIDMTAAFGRVGVTPEMLETHLGHKLEQTTIDELADMQGIFNAIREGAKASEFFGGKQEETSDDAAALSAAGQAKEPAKAQEKAKEPPKAERKAEAPREPEKGPSEPETATQAAAPAEPQEQAKPAAEPKQEAVF